MRDDETVFITGFPGFIAGRLVEGLVAAGARLLLLVQPALLDKAKAEIAELDKTTPGIAGKVRLVEGDITQSNLALTSADQELVRAEATAVFHLAAIYDLAVKRDLALTVNVEGTRNVNDFVRSLPGLRRYHYISTCYVAGKRKGLISENELRHEAGFRNYYEQSKYLAEVLVEELKSELPVTIHRPAVVCGDSRTGDTVKFDGIYYLINYLLRMPRAVGLCNIGNHRVSLNLVPVDFVIDAMVAIARDEQAIGRTIQIADPAPLTTHELFDTIALTINNSRSRLTIPAPLVEFFLSLPISPPITHLPHHAVPYFFLKQTYDTSLSSELLGRHGLSCPPFPSYVETIVDYCAKHATR